MNTQNFQTKKFFLYARKSTDTEERQVRSIDDQIAELKELAKKEAFPIEFGNVLDKELYTVSA